jgi:hypothetical protein
MSFDTIKWSINLDWWSSRVVNTSERPSKSSKKRFANNKQKSLLYGGDFCFKEKKPSPVRTTHNLPCHNLESLES